MKIGRLGAGVFDREGAKPECTDDVSKVWDALFGVLYCVEHSAQIPLRLFAQVRVVLIRHRVKQCGDAALVVIEPEVGSRDDWRVGVPRFEHVCEDTDKVTGLLRLRRDEYLVLKQRHQMRRERPRLDEVSADALVFSGRHIGEAQVFVDMHLDGGFDLRRLHVHPVVEEAVQEQAKPISARVRAFEVDLAWVDAVDLLVGLRLAVANRDNEHEQLGVFLSDLREKLDEVERPCPPRELLGVRQAVIPGLEFVEDERRWCVLEQLNEEFIARNVGALVALCLPFALDVRAVRVAVEDKIPQEFVILAVEAFANDERSRA